jgi:hypothetical protein
VSNMSDPYYYQYAFAQPGCRVQDIGPGIDARFDVELICEGPIAAVASRIGLDQFDLDKLQGKTVEDVRWLGEVATRHNDIICQAATSCAVLPLRLGTVFRSRDSLRAAAVRSRPAVAQFLEQLGDRQEWGVKVYLEKHHLKVMEKHAGAPAPHCVAVGQSGTDYLRQRKARLDDRRELRVAVHQTIEAVQQRLTDQAEQCCRIRALSSELTGRAGEMVFNAAYLLPSSTRESWLESVRLLRGDVCSRGLLLEVSGPWPPYHFCPQLEL